MDNNEEKNVDDYTQYFLETAKILEKFSGIKYLEEKKERNKRNN